ncbi:MAG: gliding motility-associated C-terminal domain-containing protein, partial [Sphingobacteriaceae bacterium]
YYATSTSQQITIGKVTPTLTITSASSLNVDQSLTVTTTTSATLGRGGNITYGITAGTGSATINSSTGLLTAISIGTVTVTASSAGDTNYYATSTSQQITIGKVTPTLTITSASSLNVDQSLTVTTTTSATLGRGGNITYGITAGTGSATINSSTGLLTAISIGTVTVTASSAGDTNYYATSTSQQITIGKATPTLTITSASSLNVDQSLTVTTTTSATLGRGGNITYGIVAGTGSATINSSTGLLTAISIGTVTVTASSAGDTNYYATSTSQQIIINKTTPTLTITSASTTVVDGTLIVAVTTTASHEVGALHYSIMNGTGVAAVNGLGIINAISAGQVTLTVTSSGNTDYYSASLTQLITINKATPILIITSSNTMKVDDALFAQVNTTATFGRGGAIAFSIMAGSGSATLDTVGGAITATGAGTVTLIATSSGDNDYNSVSTSQLITINKTTPTLIITSASNLGLGGTLTVTTATTADVSSGGVLSYQLTAGSGSATVSSNGMITANSPGTLTLTVNSAGDTNYNATSAIQLITIGKVTPTLTITSASSLIMDGTLTVTTTTTADVGSGGALSYQITAGSGSATVNNNGLLIATGAGTLTLIVSSAGDINYNMASTSQFITISKATPTLVITSSSSTVVDATFIASATTTANHPIGALSYSLLNNTGSALVNSSGIVRAVQHGIVFLRITASENSNYNSVTASQTITINRSTPTLTITSSNLIPVGGGMTATVLTTATYGRGGAKIFTISAGTGSATVNSSTGFVQAIGAGTVTLGVTTAGDGDYYPVTTSQLITIGKATPTLIITSSNTVVVYNSLTVTVSTTAGTGNGGAAAFAIGGGSGSATINSSTGLLAAISPGTVMVVVSTIGDSSYNAVSTSQLVTISKATPTLTITSGNTINVDGTLTATATTTAVSGQGGAFVYFIVAGSGSATVNASTGRITATGAGTVTLLASTIGDSNYNVASVGQVITINKVTPTLTITSSNAISGTLTATVTTTARSGRGGAITFAIVAGSGSVTVNPNTGYIQMISAGTVTLVVNAAGDSDYNAAVTSQLLSVGKSMQILTITSSNMTAVDGALMVSATTTASDGGGVISFTVMNGTGSALLVGNLVKAIQAGIITLKATSSGNTNYASATTTQVITVGRGTPTLSITSASTMMVSSTLTATVVTTATYGRGGAKTFSIVGGSGSATVNAGTGVIQSISSGTVTLTVVTAGDASYYPATASQLITIGSGVLMVEPVSKVPSGDKPVFPEKDIASDPLDVEESVKIPMVLSPNGDGLDDVLAIAHIEQYPNNELVIADRRGEAVFKAHGYNNGTVVFTGVSASGVELQEGIYYYILTWYDNKQLNRREGYFKLRR